MANLLQKAIQYFGGSKSANQTVIANLTDNKFKFFEYNNSTYTFDFSNKSNILKAINRAPQVATIVSKKAQCFNNGKYKIVNRNNEKEKATKGQFSQIFQLLERPNPLQTDAQFRANVYFYIQTFGFCPVWTVKGYDVLNSSDPIITSRMWVLPPQYVDIVMKRNINLLEIDNIKDAIESISFNYEGKVELPIDDIYLFTDITANYNSILLPESRLTTLSQPLSNLINNYDAVNELLYNRGALGILSNMAAGNTNVVPMMPNEKEQVQDEYANYGFLKGQKKIIITNASLQWQKIGLNFKELGLNELYDRDVKDIAQGLNYPLPLLTMDGSTFSNQATAEKSLYQNAIIPESENYTQQLTDLLMVKGNYKIVLDFSHIECLQDDKLKQSQRKGVDIRNAQLLFDGNKITYNRMLELSGEPLVSGMDLYKHEIPFFNEVQPPIA